MIARRNLRPHPRSRWRLPGVLLVVVIAMSARTDRVEAQLLPPPSCTLGMASAAFGNYNPLSATPLDTSGTLSYSCNLTAPLPTIALSTGSSLSFAARTMTSAGGGVLQYDLYLDPVHLVVWGDGADLSTSRFVGVGLLGSVTFYGSIPARQSVPAGSYSDTLVATIYF
jgi:spore coat protein U-like protein